jgi:transcriptional regulator with XRE-family HTH domain
MSKRIKATINPALLIWARTTAGYELMGAAEALDLSQEKLEAWEEGEVQPSIPQLRKLAEFYKRPLAVLYLPEPPQTFHGSSPCAPTIEIKDLRNIFHYSFKSQDRQGSYEGNKVPQLRRLRPAGVAASLKFSCI